MNCPNWVCVCTSFRSKVKLKSNPEAQSQFQLYGLQFPRCYAGLHQNFLQFADKIEKSLFFFGVFL